MNSESDVVVCVIGVGYDACLFACNRIEAVLTRAVCELALIAFLCACCAESRNALSCIDK